MNWDRILYPLDLVGCNLLGRSFVGAFNIDGVLNVGRDLKKRGFGVTYNLLGEHVPDPSMVDKAIDSTIRLIQQMNNENLGNVSCKPTLYGLSISKELFFRNIQRIIDLAKARGIGVEFDAENYAHIEDTFDVFSSFASQEAYSNTVRQAVQAHLVNIESLMDKYKLWDKNLRIVKGSGVYKEDKSIDQRSDFLVTERYTEILRRSLRNGRSPFVATVRDGELASEAIDVADSLSRTVTIQTLYGPLSSRLVNKLLQDGHSVNIYVPFTDDWCRGVWKPYGLRRAQMMRRIIWKECCNRVSVS